MSINISIFQQEMQEYHAADVQVHVIHHGITTELNRALNSVGKLTLSTGKMVLTFPL